MTPALHIAFAIDGQYLRQLRVLWSSLFDNHGPGELTLHVLHSDLDPAQRHRLETIAARHGAPCLFHTIPGAWTDPFPRNEDFPSRSQFYRIFLPELLGREVSRVLYLDADLVACRNLAPLASENLGGRAVAAAEDLDAPASCLRLGIPSPFGYFNSGVLLIDTSAWMERDVPARVKDYLLRHRGDRSRSVYPDQDALNAVLCEDRHRLAPEWNLFAVCRWFAPEQLAPDQREALGRPAIIHFIGPDKPWLPHCAPPYHQLYRRCAMRAGVRLPIPLSPKTFLGRRLQEQRLRAMRQRYRRAGLPDDF